MKYQYSITIAAVAILACSVGAQPAEQKETSGMRHIAASEGPRVVKWPLKSLKGEANLIVNPDGTYLFSGNVDDIRPKHDFVIALALKSDFGGAIVFRYSGTMANRVQWSKQGRSPILKDNFKSFAAKADWAGEWRTPLNAKGEAAKYEEREKQEQKLKREEAEARKRHDEKEAREKRDEREKLQQEEIAQAQAAQQQSNGGGGSSIGSDISSVASTIGSVVNTVSSVGQAIAGLF